MTEVAIDQSAAERQGLPRESLARVAAEQPYPTGGVHISRTAGKPCGRHGRVASSASGPRQRHSRSCEPLS